MRAAVDIFEDAIPHEAQPMKHRSVVRVVCLLPSMLVLAIPLWAQDSLVTVVKRIKPSVVAITTYDAQGNEKAVGTGFFVNDTGEIVTSRHVLAGATSATVRTSQGERFSITYIVAEDVQGDLVRASTDIPDDAVHPLALSASLVEEGERVVVISSPLGLKGSVSEGIVSAVREAPSFGTIVQITAPISPGSSGSPVVNLKGEGIGVATLQMKEGQNLNFAIPAQRVAALKTDIRTPLAEWTAAVKAQARFEIQLLYAIGGLSSAMEKWMSKSPFIFCAGYCKRSESCRCLFL